MPNSRSWHRGKGITFHAGGSSPNKTASGNLSGRSSAWLERLLWEQEVVSSNLAAPTRNSDRPSRERMYCNEPIGSLCRTIVPNGSAVSVEPSDSPRDRPRDSPRDYPFRRAVRRKPTTSDANEPRRVTSPTELRRSAGWSGNDPRRGLTPSGSPRDRPRDSPRDYPFRRAVRRKPTTSDANEPRRVTSPTELRRSTGW